MLETIIDQEGRVIIFVDNDKLNTFLKTLIDVYISPRRGQSRHTGSSLSRTYITAKHILIAP